MLAKTDLPIETKRDSKKRYSTNYRSSCSEVFCKKDIVFSTVLTAPPPHEKLTPRAGNPPTLIVTSPPLPRVPLLKVGGNSYYHSPFPNKNMARSLPPSLTHARTHSFTHPLTHAPTHPLTHAPTHSLSYLLTYLLTYLERMGENHYNICLP